ncbi:MAG: DUF1499 domain-containing protein [Lysobacterales bacterium]
MKFARLPLILAALAALALLLAGPGVRLGLWPFPLAFLIIRYATFTGIAALLFAVLLLIVPRTRVSAPRALLLALALAVPSVAMPLWLLGQARSLPPIHDISTDTVDVPAFVAILPLRAEASNPVEYGGLEIAAQQLQAYADITPLLIALPVDRAFDRALAAAQDMGWEIVASEASAGRIEATATTPMFGFKDDVVIRVRPDGAGSRVDVRSLSRVGRSDLGANAKRIRAYLKRLSAH